MNKSFKQINEERYAILHSNDYPAKAGMLKAEAEILRRSLKRIVEALKATGHDGYPLIDAEIDLNITAYLDAKPPEIMPPDQPQQDRTLASGKIKTATGFVEEPTSTSVHDMDGYGRDGF